jgi:O-antigen/teichoic acid export membrane protein
VGYILWIAPSAPISILSFVLCQLISYLLTLLLAQIFVSHHDLKGALGFKFDLLFARALLKKSIPYALVLFLMTLYTRLDGVMIERLLPDGQTQAGIYAASYRILDAFSNVGLLFAGLLLPMFAKMIRNNVPVGDLTLFSRNVLLIFSLTLTAISFVYHDSIIFTLYPDADEEWSVLYKILFVSYLGTSIAYIYGTLLTANESIRSMNMIFAAGVLLNLALNFVFILTWKAWGAAMATLITQLATATALVVLAHRHLKLDLGLSNWIRLLAFAGLILACTYWSKLWPLHWYLSAFVVGLLALPIAFSLRLMSFRAWQDATV